MSEFDEAAARKHFGMNSDCIDTSNDLECFVEGARWAHSLMQERLAAMQNQIALYNRDSDDRHNEMAQLRAENAQLSATCERYRSVLIVCKEKLVIYRSNTNGEYQGGMEFEALMSWIKEALESGERGGEG